MKYAHESLIEMIVGPLIGKGAHRSVYAYRDNPNMVIKIERKSKRALQNVTEYLLYRDAQLATNGAHTWLAPVYRISDDGLVLIQHRTTPHNKFGETVELPKWMGNTTASNFGMIKDRFVCHDYGDHQANLFGLQLDEMQTVTLK